MERGSEAVSDPGARSRLRWLLAAVCMALGMTSMSATTANVLARADAQRAAQLAVLGGSVSARAAQDLYALHPSADARSPAALMARAAIVDDPTAVAALEVLAFQASLAGEKARSDAIFGHIAQLSRRSLRSQMWAIEHAVERGDVRGALRHYDLALRTSREAPALLYPTLATALREPRIREGLVEIVSARPEWSETFFTFLANSAIAPVNSFAFFERLSERGIAPSDEVKASLVDQLFANRAFDEAFQLYKTFRVNAETTRSRDPKFEVITSRAAIFDWMPGEASGLSVGIFPKKGGGLVDFALAPNVGGTVIQQLQILPPGTYRLAGRMTGIEQPVATRPYWVLTCEGGRELGRVEISNSSEKPSFSGLVNVPAGCAVQTVALIARPSAGIGGVAGQVHSAALSPVELK